MWEGVVNWVNENFYSPLLSFFEFAGYLATALAVGGTIIGLAMLGGRNMDDVVLFGRRRILRRRRRRY